jgi:monothiol bacilliredoxin
MENHFSQITETGALEELFARSNVQPVVLFKHSATCPISAAAYEQMKKVQTDVALVVVQQATDVSREIEARTGVQHETPQVIVLRASRPVWEASHWEVKADAVSNALRQHS